MKIDFGKYIYYDPTKPDSSDVTPIQASRGGKVYGQDIDSYAFDYKSEYTKAVNNKQYMEAYNHAVRYHFKDAETQDAYKNTLMSLRENGSIAEGIYSKIQGDDKYAVDFADMVGVDGGLEMLDQNNPYVARFSELKKQLGGEGSSKIRINFEKKERNLFGWKWTDALVKDNPYGFEDFLSALGMDEAALRDKGIEPKIEKDGSTTIEFSKTHPYANKLIYAIPHRGISGKVWDTVLGYDSPFATLTHDYPLLFSNPMEWMRGYANRVRDKVLDRKDQNGLPLTGERETGIHITGLDDNGNEVDTSHNGDWTLRQIKSLIKESREIKENYSSILTEPKQYSSTVGPLLNLEVERLKNENLDEDEFLKRVKLLNNKWDNFLSTAAWEDYDIYTNYGDGRADTDATLIKLENDPDKQTLMQHLAVANPKDLYFNAMISNGKAGVLITLDRALQKDKGSNSINGINEDKRIQVFIPDNGKSSIFNEVREAINKDPRVKAASELNNMQDWGYKRKFFGNKGSLQYAGTIQGNVKFKHIDEHNKESYITPEQAQALIAKDNFIEYFATNIIDQYVTSNDKLITTPGDPLGGARAYEELARNAAIKTGENLYPNIPMTYGDATPVTMIDIIKYLWGSSEEERERWLNNFNFEQQRKFIDIFDSYRQIMEVLKYYGVTNINQLYNTNLN